MVGIICEYNPFHNGHLYHLNKVKEMFPNKVIVLILGSSFLNRGDVSVINKWDKTKIALKYGVDLVVELPTVFSVQSADIYAYSAVRILNHLKCEYLLFGSECGDIDKLYLTADKLLEYKDISNLLKKGYTYPKSIALSYDTNIDSPNDLLGISYIKAIKKLNSNIKAITIKRTNNYHSQLLSEVCSATSIRKALINQENVSNSLPNDVLKYIKNISLNDYYMYIKYQIINNDIHKCNIDIKLANRFKNVISETSNLDELINKSKTKNYSYNHVKRSLVQILCGITKNDLEIDYVRILGFNKKGQNYLNKIKKEIKVPLITNYNSLLDTEFKISKIYSLVDDVCFNELDKPVIYDETS